MDENDKMDKKFGNHYYKNMTYINKEISFRMPLTSWIGGMGLLLFNFII